MSIMGQLREFFQVVLILEPTLEGKPPPQILQRESKYNERPKAFLYYLYSFSLTKEIIILRS